MIHIICIQELILTTMAPKLNSTIKIKNKSDTIFIIYLIQMILALIFMK